MAKQIIFADDARAKMLDGLRNLYDAVRTTMGPKGRNVVIEKSYGSPTITNDGVSIAKEIDFADPFENMGAQLVKEVATKTNDVAGDGTTTATVLAYAIIKEGLRNVTAGANPMVIRHGIDKAVSAVLDVLAENAVAITDKEKIAQVATISAQNPEVGAMIADVMDTVGKDGVITVEDSQTFGLSKEVVEGMQFDNGYISPYMVTDTARMEAVYDNAKILITDKKISSIQDILPLLEKLAQSGTKNLVIIAEDVDGEALTTLVLNKLRGTFHTLAIKAPAFGDRRKEMLKDIAALTGGTVITEELGLKLESADLHHLGEAHKVVSDKDHTIIIDGKGEKAAIEARVHEIKAQMSATKSDFDREKLIERLAKMTGGVAVIKVGAATEVELKEKKHRIEDALAATRAAVEEGIVAGGGTALLKAIVKLEALAEAEQHTDIKVGIEIVRRAIEYPARQIAENSGKEASVIVNEVRKNADANFGYDAQEDRFTDLLAAGIVDPKKVTRSALQHAASIASMFLTTEAAVAELPAEKDAGGAAGMPGGMGGMGMPGMGMM